MPDCWITITATEHWRGGARFYAQCDCGWRGRNWGAPVDAQTDARVHLDTPPNTAGSGASNG